MSEATSQDGDTEQATGTLIHVTHGSENTWHHSVEFDGYTHFTACGQAFDCDRFDELRMNIGDWVDLDPTECCEDCADSVRSLEPAVPDGDPALDGDDYVSTGESNE